MTQNNRHPSSYVDGHGIKGALGAERAKSYTPSSYGGDEGGSAGGYGVGKSHGLGPDESAFGSAKMSAHGYGGATLSFEGGVRAGGVSEPETLPGQNPFPRKKGYDEHRGHGFAPEGTVHGLPGVEGLKTPKKRPGDPEEGPKRADGMDGAGGERSEDTPMTDGFACSHGCGNMKSRHGLARHTVAKHGYGKLGHALTSHGSDYSPKHKDSGPSGESSSGETRGETEGPAAMSAIRREYDAAQPSGRVASSYGTGDGGGSCGKVVR